MSSPILVVVMSLRGIVANKIIVVGPRDVMQCSENRPISVLLLCRAEQSLLVLEHREDVERLEGEVYAR